MCLSQSSEQTCYPLRTWTVLFKVARKHSGAGWGACMRSRTSLILGVPATPYNPKASEAASSDSWDERSTSTAGAAQMPTSPGPVHVLQPARVAMAVPGAGRADEGTDRWHLRLQGDGTGAAWPCRLCMVPSPGKGRVLGKPLYGIPAGRRPQPRLPAATRSPGQSTTRDLFPQMKHETTQQRHDTRVHPDMGSPGPREGEPPEDSGWPLDVAQSFPMWVSPSEQGLLCHLGSQADWP
ncbi:hypothetical protein TREES_T100000861 [Tupaia chinensis]|uniref:Uncharacterized protein n=1 Tax=Tupaia chinensis TaxID=246437 RepID=L9JIU7_TUPCH|nr:hypothetical protein TREES_T100000861 [Tupaia chinensis]